MGEVSGHGHAKLLDDGSIEITCAYHVGDDATMRVLGFAGRKKTRPLDCSEPNTKFCSRRAVGPADRLQRGRGFRTRENEQVRQMTA